MLFSVRAVAAFSAAFLALGTSLFAGVETHTSASWVDSPTQLLTLDQAVEMALTNNLDAKIDRVGIGIADSRVRLAWGEFDPVLALNTARSEINTPQNPTNLSASEAAQQERQLQAQREQTLAIQQLVALQTGRPIPTTLTDLPTLSTEPLLFEQTNRSTSSNIQGKLPTGTAYRFNAEFTRLDTVLTDTGTRFAPSNSGTVSVTVDQPLLRDFGFGANLAGVRITRRDRKIAFNTWKQSVINAVGSVMASYADMVYSLELVRGTENAIEAGQRLVTGNQRRLDLGLMSPIDVRQAQVALAEDQQRLLAQRNLFMERQFALKRQILKEYQSGEDRTFIPAGGLPLDLPALDRSALLREAFQHRTDYLSAIEQAERENIRLRFARNQLLPKLDVVATAGLNGLSTRGSGFDEAFSTRGPIWSVGVQASIPLGNVQARAQHAIVRGAKEQALLRIKQTELTVSVDVDTILSRIRTAQQSVRTNREAVKVAEESLRIQFRRLEQGQVSSFELIDTQKRLFETRGREIEARNALDKAIVQLWIATGTLLEARGVTAVDDPRVR